MEMEDYGSDFESDDGDDILDKSHQSLSAVERTDEYHSEECEEDEGTDGSEDRCSDSGEESAAGPGSERTASGAAGAGAAGGSGVSASHHPAALRPTRRRLQRYLLKARRAYRRRQPEPAVAHCVRALALARLAHGERHWRTLRCQVLLARAYLDLQGLPVQAEEHASEALTVLLMYQGTELAPDGKHQVVYVQLLARLIRGQALVALHRPAAAEESLHKAAALLTTYSRVRPTAATKSLLLRLHTALGRAGAARGRLETARGRLEAALELLEAGGEREERVRLMRELAEVEGRGARRQEAERAVWWLRKAAELAAECWGPGSADHLDTRLACVRAESRLVGADPAAAAEALAGLHQSCVAALGAGHSVSARAADLLIQVHTEQEYYEKAARECRDNTRAKIQTHGELSRPVLDSLRTLSQLYVSCGQVERAVQISRRAWAMEALMLGRRDRRVLAAQTALNQLERRLDGGRGRSGGRSSASTATPSIDDTLRL